MTWAWLELPTFQLRLPSHCTPHRVWWPVSFMLASKMWSNLFNPCTIWIDICSFVFHCHIEDAPCVKFDWSVSIYVTSHVLNFCVFFTGKQLDCIHGAITKLLAMIGSFNFQTIQKRTSTFFNVCYCHFLCRLKNYKDTLVITWLEKPANVKDILFYQIT